MYAGEYAGMRLRRARRVRRISRANRAEDDWAEVDRICRRNGVEVPGEEMEAILNRLNIDTVLAGNTLTCEIPTYRQDMETDADIAEEISECTATIIFRLR